MRSALSVSLIFACAICMAGPYTDLKQKLDRAGSDAEVVRLVSTSPVASTRPDVRQTLNQDEPAASLKTQIELLAMAEARGSTSSGIQQQVQAIKRSPFYNDPGIDRKRNWLADALERIRNIKLNLEPRQSNVRAPSFFGPFFTAVAWCLLAIGVMTLVYFAVRHIKWQGTLTRKAKTLMEEDEPDRTLDEWLQLADHHAAAGRHREAVRALYLACLLKFDEADVARFDRGETNWEHLGRIEDSPKFPAGLDFRTPTQRFDRIWYGYQTKGMADVDQFREWYRLVGEAVKGAKS